MHPSWAEFFNQALNQKSTDGLLRTRGGPVRQSVRTLIDFGSNDYLGLRSDPRVLAAGRLAAAVGSGASPVLSGHTSAHAALETKLAELHGCDSALAFSSGYACNVGVIACLAGADDLIVSDELNHASLIDGCRQSRARVEVFAHNNVRHLEQILSQQRTHFAKVLVLTESVFSMDGDLAPLVSIAELCERFECGLVVDEAHATGVFGEAGSGLVEELGLQQAVLAKLGTLSKSLGTIGGYVCGSAAMVEYVVNYCRSYMFSTALPIPMALSASAAIETLKTSHAARQSLRDRSRQLRQDLREQGWNVPVGESPVVPVLIVNDARVVALSERLVELGIYAPAIRPPTVPAGTSRLRISLSTTHSDDEYRQLTSVLATLRTL